MIEREKFRRILDVALPLMGALLAQSGLEVIDTLMMGQLGYRELAGGGLASSLYLVLIVLSGGVMSAVGVYIARARARSDALAIEHSFHAGMQLSVILAGLGCAATLSIPYLLRALGQSSAIVSVVEVYLHGLVWGYPAILLYFLTREYLTAYEKPRIILVISILGLPCNALLNYAFMYGAGPIPALGIAGVGYATAIIEWIGAGILLLAVLRLFPKALACWSHFEGAALRALLALGAPVAVTMFSEVALFSMASFLAGYLGEKALAAHQIALQLTSITIMLSIGLSQAGAVIMGQLSEAGKPLGAWALHFILIALCFAGISATLFIFFPGLLVSFYIDEVAHPDLLRDGAGLLQIAALFQLGDALQVLFNGLLRGMRDSVWPMLFNIATYIGVGVASAYVLAFNLHYGIYGLWMGLAFGVTTTAIALGLRLRMHLMGDGIGLVST